MDLPLKRKVTPDDYPLIRAKINEAHQALLDAGTKSIGKIMSLDRVMAMLARLEHVYFVGPFLVSYVIDQPWFADEPLLCEMIVCRVSDEPAGFFTVTNFLESEAQRHEVKWVAVGTLLAINDGPLASAYIRQGYEPSLRQLVKEL